MGAFVELLWTEATGRLGDILAAPVEKLSLNDVSELAPAGHRDHLLILFPTGEQGGGVAAPGSQEAAGGEAQRGGVPPGGGSSPAALQRASVQGSPVGVPEAGRVSGSPEDSGAEAAQQEAPV